MAAATRTKASQFGETSMAMVAIMKAGLSDEIPSRGGFRADRSRGETHRGEPFRKRYGLPTVGSSGFARLRIARGRDVDRSLRLRGRRGLHGSGGAALRVRDAPFARV